MRVQQETPEQHLTALKERCQYLLAENQVMREKLEFVKEKLWQTPDCRCNQCNTAREILDKVKE